MSVFHWTATTFIPSWLYRVAAVAQTAVVVKGLRQALDSLLRRRAESTSGRIGRPPASLGNGNCDAGVQDEKLLDAIANLLRESEKI